jgi:hypothetical protein
MMKGHNWSDQENATLRALFPTHSNPEIGEWLGLTRNQVKVQATKLGLKRPAKFASEHARRRTIGRAYPNRKLKQQIGSVVWRPPAGKKAGHQWYIFTGKRQVVALKRHLWEMHVGPIPATHVVRYRNGNPQRCVLSNLECVPRGELISSNANREKAVATITEGRARRSYYASRLFKNNPAAALYVLNHQPGLLNTYIQSLRLTKTLRDL